VISDRGANGENRIGKENESIRRKHIPMLLYPTYFPDDLLFYSETKVRVAINVTIPESFRNIGLLRVSESHAFLETAVEVLSTTSACCFLYISFTFIANPSFQS
jgi:hypothetical protein